MGKRTYERLFKKQERKNRREKQKKEKGQQKASKFLQESLDLLIAKESGQLPDFENVIDKKVTSNNKKIKYSLGIKGYSDTYIRTLLNIRDQYAHDGKSVNSEALFEETAYALQCLGWQAWDMYDINDPKGMRLFYEMALSDARSDNFLKGLRRQTPTYYS